MHTTARAAKDIPMGRKALGFLSINGVVIGLYFVIQSKSCQAPDTHRPLNFLDIFSFQAIAFLSHVRPGPFNGLASERGNENHEIDGGAQYQNDERYLAGSRKESPYRVAAPAHKPQTG